MDRVLQAQEDALNAFQNNISPGRVGSLFFYFKGTNKVGQVGSFTDLGSVVVKRKGETILNRPISVLADKGNVLYGSNKLSSTDGGAFIATCKHDFFVKTFEQALQIAGPNELNIEYVPGANASTVFASLQISVYSEITFLDEIYDHFLLGDDQTPAAAVTARPYQLNARNVAAVYLSDPSGVLTSVGLRQNGEQVYSDQPKDVLEGGTLYGNRLEQSTISMLELQTYTERQPASLLNENTILELTTSGTGKIEVTRESIRLKNDGQGVGRMVSQGAPGRF